MRKIYSALLGLFCSTSLVAQTVGVYPTGAAGCIARWTFDGNTTTIVDSSGNNNNGTWSNVTPSLGWRDVPNQAVKLNGYSTQGIVPSSPTLKPSQMTMVALVRMDAYNQALCQNSEIFLKGYDRAPGNYFMRINDNLYDNNCNNFYPNYQCLDVYFDLEAPNIQMAPPTLELNNWYFLAATFDGVTKHMFQIKMDTGFYNPPTIPFFTKNATIQLSSNDLPLYFGYDPNANCCQYFRFNGAFDEIILFNRALDRKELINVYTFLWNKGKQTSTSVANVVKDQLKYNLSGKQLHLSYGSAIENEVQVSDMTGKIIKELKFRSSSIIDLSSFANQVFVVKIFNKEGAHSFKIVNQ